MQKMADEEIRMIKKRMQTVVLFYSNKKCCVNAEIFVPIVVLSGPLLQKLFTSFISSFNRMVYNVGKEMLMCIAHRILQLSEQPYKEALEGRGRIQNIQMTRAVNFAK